MSTVQISPFSSLGAVRAEIELLKVTVCFGESFIVQDALCYYWFSQQRGLSGRMEGGRGGGGECKKLWLKLKNATKWNKDECSTEPQTEYKRQSCEIYMAGRRDEQNAKLQTCNPQHRPWSWACWSPRNIKGSCQQQWSVQRSGFLIT